jgi:hypothetical protein
MNQATADLPETASAEQTGEQVLTDMLAEFANESHDSAPTETPTQEPEALANPDEDQSPATERDSSPSPTDEAVDRLAAALQRLDALEAAHKKHSDDVYGRVGSMEQILRAQARTPVGQKVKVTIDDFGEFGSEYPDFAQAQLKVINKALSEMEVTGLSPEFTTDLLKNAGKTAETVAEAKLSHRESVRCREELAETHPGWLDTIGLPEQDGGTPPDTEYRRWLATQPKEYAERVLNSYSSLVIGKSLDKFDAWKNAHKKTTASVTPISSRQQRLTAAVTPRTSGTTPAPKKELTGRAAMLEAFNE